VLLNKFSPIRFSPKFPLFNFYHLFSNSGKTHTFTSNCFPHTKFALIKGCLHIPSHPCIASGREGGARCSVRGAKRSLNRHTIHTYHDTYRWILQYHPTLLSLCNYFCRNVFSYIIIIIRWAQNVFSKTNQYFGFSSFFNTFERVTYSRLYSFVDIFHTTSNF